MHQSPDLSRKSHESHIYSLVGYIQFAAHLLYRFCYSVGMFSAVLLCHAGRSAKRLLKPVRDLLLCVLIRLAAWADRLVGRQVRRVADVLCRTARGLGRALSAGAQARKERGILAGAKAVFRFSASSLGRHRAFLRSGVRLIAPTLALVVLVTTISVWSTVTFALEVNVGGQTVGYVSDESVFADAYELMKLRVVDDGTDGFTMEIPQYTMTIVSNDRLLDATTLCDNLITASCDEITQGCGLYVDGELIAVTASKASLQTVLDGILTAAVGEDPQVVEAAFDNEIVYKEGLYPVDNVVSQETAQTLLTATHEELDTYTLAAGSADVEDIASADGNEASATQPQGSSPQISQEITTNGSALKAQVNTRVLNVKLVRTEVYEEAIAYETEEIEDSSKLEGYRKVTTQGVEGSRRVTANVEYVDGQETSRDILQEEVLSEPVTEQLVVGTRSIAAYSQKTVNMEQLFWPVARVSGSYVSSYFGDGRNHKGVDICAPAGTPIYAAASGTVVSVNGSGWGYGLHFVIDHGNGVQTLYSHCSTMAVEVGQQVTRGEQIATIGRTGNATGNHLHFEVRVGGTPYNPAPFLGLE